MVGCYACRKARVTRSHLSTAAHRRAVAAPVAATLRSGRPGWMIALRDWADQDQDRWPEYPQVGIAPLIGDPPP